MSKYIFDKDDDGSTEGFGGSLKTKKKSSKDKTNKTFNQLVKSLYRSTVLAQSKVEQLHYQNFITNYFDEDGKPNFITLTLPSNDGDGAHSVNVDVPLLTLSHSTHLNIKELEIEFEVELGHFEDIEDDEISAKVSTVTGKNMAKIKLKLDAATPPEGIARIRQELIKILPS